MNIHDPTLKGRIFDIQRFSLHDGPGIRTSVFLKGCPLRCRWCHNPESQASKPELAFTAALCIHCGACSKTCTRQAHIIAAGESRRIDRLRCIGCGQCAMECPTRALEWIGSEITVEDLLAEVLRDKAFYDHSGGGLTVSGGEPMAQPAFTIALLHAARQAGLDTCLDSCGFADFSCYESVLENVNLFLYDIKDTEPSRHLDNTGVPLDLILDNLKRIDAAGGRSWLRCPLIPGVNTDRTHLVRLAAIANTLTNVVGITLLPYHPLGQSKYIRLGLSDPMTGCPIPTDKEIQRWQAAVANRTVIPVTVE